MIKLVAKKEFYFDGRMIKPGEEFDSEEKFVTILVLSDSAREASDQHASDSTIEAPVAGRRKYKRRDMAAEG